MLSRSSESASLRLTAMSFFVMASTTSGVSVLWGAPRVCCITSGSSSVFANSAKIAADLVAASASGTGLNTMR